MTTVTARRNFPIMIIGTLILLLAIVLTGYLMNAVRTVNQAETQPSTFAPTEANHATVGLPAPATVKTGEDLKAATSSLDSSDLSTIPAATKLNAEDVAAILAAGTK